MGRSQRFEAVSSYGEAALPATRSSAPIRSTAARGQRPHVGRFINDTDMREYRRVAVIGTHVRNTLFKLPKSPSAEPSGRQHALQVVGVIDAAGAASYFRDT